MTTAYTDKVTDIIVKSLEKGEIPWRKPWKTQPPANYVTLRRYTGINPFVLWITAEEKKYKSNLWLTFNQTKNAGGSVKAGEHMTPVIFWKVDSERITDESKMTPEEIVRFREGKKIWHKQFIFRVYGVFNYEQTTGLKPKDVGVDHGDPIESAEKIVAGYQNKPEIVSSNSAWYRMSNDQIGIPEKNLFTVHEEYYSTLFHEMVHSTGHEKRLNRKAVTSSTKQFGSEDYSKEELVAEFGSAFLCSESGISPKTIENQTAYIQNWLKALKDDKRQLIYASASAQRAVNHILNVKEQEES